MTAPKTTPGVISPKAVETDFDPLIIARLDRVEIESAFAERGNARFHRRQAFAGFTRAA